MVFQDYMNWVALVWFLTCWVGYTYYSKRKAENTECLSAQLYSFRIDWVRNLMRRENRISDLALLNNLVQMVNFLATTNIFVLAGAVTVLYSSGHIIDLLANHPFVANTSVEEVQIKLITLVLIFVYAFFRFTWAMRQHTFVSILIGAAPNVVQGQPLTQDQEDFAIQVAKVSDRAAHDFNYGLRSYYFALSLLPWFINPWIFMFTAALVVAVLYIREFRSRTLRILVRSRESYLRIYQADSKAPSIIPSKLLAPPPI
ncbi:MAG: DUF599 family protein [Micavibrio sp.]|nr:DUF599 family protein [Micavibrio sp.]